ncbi:hypothetical protein ABK040_007989 [Willaertia magna]
MKNIKALNIFVIFSFLFLFFIVCSKVTVGSELDNALRRVAERCPSMTITGIKKSCGGGLMKASPSDPDDLFRSLVVAGLGYDTFNHQIKGQVLNSKPLKEIDQTKMLSREMTSAESIYDTFYPRLAFKNLYNGLNSRRLGSTDLFSNFFKGNMKVAICQKQYLSHFTSVTYNQDRTDEFKEILRLLPVTYDQESYQKIIDYFGDSVATEITYGGVIDQMTSVRVCYNDPAMLRYVEQQLNSDIDAFTAAKPPNGFINYAKSSQLTIVGGNPQESDTVKRIRSFKNNPAPVLLFVIPIHMVFPLGPKGNNMKRAYDEYINNMNLKIGAQVRNLKNLIEQQPTLNPAICPRVN